MAEQHRQPWSDNGTEAVEDADADVQAECSHTGRNVLHHENVHHHKVVVGGDAGNEAANGKRDFVGGKNRQPISDNARQMSKNEHRKAPDDIGEYSQHERSNDRADEVGRLTHYRLPGVLAHPAQFAGHALVAEEKIVVEDPLLAWYYKLRRGFTLSTTFCVILKVVVGR